MAGHAQPVLKVREPVARLQREIADTDAGTVGRAGRLVEGQAWNHAHRDPVGEPVQHVAERAQIVLGRRGAVRAVRVEAAVADHVEQVGLDQHVPLRQRRRRGRQHRTGPPRIIARLLIRAARRHGTQQRCSGQPQRQRVCPCDVAIRRLSCGPVKLAQGRVWCRSAAAPRTPFPAVCRSLTDRAARGRPNVNQVTLGRGD